MKRYNNNNNNSSNNSNKYQLSTKNSETSYNEISTILKESNNSNNLNYFEFSKSDFSLTLEKEKDGILNFFNLFNFFI